MRNALWLAHSMDIYDLHFMKDIHAVLNSSSFIIFSEYANNKRDTVYLFLSLNKCTTLLHEMW